MTMWILGAFFVLVGLPFLEIARRAFKRDRAVTGWPRQPGVIHSAVLESWVQTSRDKNGFDIQYTVYKPVVRYRYTVDGREYESTRVAQAVDDVATGQAAAQQVIDRYAPGTQVMVLVNPGDPTASWLEVQRSVGAVILLAFGALWIAIGVLLIGLWLRSWLS
jgi:Protein of unknown function (DUF3592)